MVKIGQNTKPIALLFDENWPILAAFHSTIKISQIDFWSKLGKIPWLEPYFLAKIGQFFPLFTLQLRSRKMIFGQIWAKYQGYSLTFCQNWPFYPLFTAQCKSIPLIFCQNSVKYEAYNLNLSPKFALFTHFSFYNHNYSDRFLVKIGQNTKNIALIFGQNSPILPTCHSKIQINNNEFWSKLGKIPRL